MTRPRTVSDQQLLDAAREVFLESGFGGSTIEIARRAGVSEALLYKRFSSKEHLFVAAMLPSDRPDWLDRVAELCGRGDLRQNLEQIGRWVLDHFMAIAPLLLTYSGRGHAEARRLAEHPMAVSTLTELTAFFDREIALGRMRPISAEIAARTFLGTLANHAFMDVMGVNTVLPLEGPELTRRFVALLWDGLAPPAR